jgi:predicted site-specific integrase-resolvase
MSDTLEYLTTAELAAELTKIGLKMSERTARQYHKDGKIPSAVSESRRVRFRLEDVKAALAARAKKKGKK